MYHSYPEWRFDVYLRIFIDLLLWGSFIVLRRLQLCENNMAHVALQQFIPLCEWYKTQERNGTFAVANPMGEIPSLFDIPA
jgi:hypothetical protein